MKRCTYPKPCGRQGCCLADSDDPFPHMVLLCIVLFWVFLLGGILVATGCTSSAKQECRTFQAAVRGALVRCPDVSVDFLYDCERVQSFDSGNPELCASALDKMTCEELGALDPGSSSFPVDCRSKAWVN